jgi:Ca2+-binding EF-hand superfamily protein
MIGSIGQYQYTNTTSSTSATHKRLTPEEMFAKIDTNGDGTIDKAEFTAFGQQMASKIGKADKSEELFAKIDTNGDGKITKAENDAFMSQMKANRPQGAMPPPSGMNPDELFAKMDANGDGSVDKAEFKTFQQQMQKQSEATSKSDELFSQIDTDGDGKISKSESDTFIAKMKSEMQSMLLNTLSNPSSSEQSSQTDTNSLYSAVSQRYTQSLTPNATSAIDMLG